MGVSIMKFKSGDLVLVYDENQSDNIGTHLGIIIAIVEQQVGHYNLLPIYHVLVSDKQKQTCHMLATSSPNFWIHKCLHTIPAT